MGAGKGEVKKGAVGHGRHPACTLAHGDGVRQGGDAHGAKSASMVQTIGFYGRFLITAAPLVQSTRDRETLASAT